MRQSKVERYPRNCSKLLAGDMASQSSLVRCAKNILFSSTPSVIVMISYPVFINKHGLILPLKQWKSSGPIIKTQKVLVGPRSDTLAGPPPPSHWGVAQEQ